MASVDLVGQVLDSRGEGAQESEGVALLQFFLRGDDLVARRCEFGQQVLPILPSQGLEGPDPSAREDIGRDFQVLGSDGLLQIPVGDPGHPPPRRGVGDPGRGDEPGDLPLLPGQIQDRGNG